MSAAISLRDDYNGGQLRALAKTLKDANQTRRLLCPPVSNCAAGIRLVVSRIFRTFVFGLVADLVRLSSSAA